ncbi:hypothetical protein ACFQ6U_33255 [Streptomyces sp. NPDC056465]|uniref:hypothetical protein n=1 Tax=unclassified Streptomyces TaxID=2593676 RepID=UPI0035E34DC5
MTSVQWFHDHWADKTVGDWWTRRWVHELVRRLKTDEDPAHWTESVAELRSELDEVIPNQAANPFTAAHLYFALDLVDTINLVQEHRQMAPGYLIQVALTDKELAKAAGFPAAPVCNPPRGSSLPAETRPRRNLLGRYPKVPLDGRLPLAGLPDQWFRYLLRHNQTGVLKSLYQLSHDRGSASVLHCVRNSKNLAEWHAGMALQIVAYAGQMLTPVSDHGVAFAPGEAPDPSGLDARYHPLAQLLFSPDELTSLRRQEAYMSEQFAHLFTAVIFGLHLQENLDALVRAVGEACGGFLEKRKSLRAMRGRYEAPPYLIPELDALLKAAAARASATGVAADDDNAELNG